MGSETGLFSFALTVISESYGCICCLLPSTSGVGILILPGPLKMRIWGTRTTNKEKCPVLGCAWIGSATIFAYNPFLKAGRTPHDSSECVRIKSLVNSHLLDFFF